MAFGSWLKGLIGTASSIASKVLPVAQKVIGTAAPIAQKIGGMIGGKAGGAIQKFAGKAQGFMDKASSFLGSHNAVLGGNPNPRGMVGVGGAGIRKIVPKLKEDEFDDGAVDTW